MAPRNGLLQRLAHWLHHHFLWLLLGCYVAAALFPAAGLWLRGLEVGQVRLGNERARLSLPALLLALLLCNAGLGMQTQHLKRLLSRPFLLLAALLANLLVPTLFILGSWQTLRLWHNPDEVQNILVGLALVGSMPVAGSSTAWSQNGNGDLALSLGLVVFSTGLSPLTTPLLLHAVGFLTTGVYAAGLQELASGGTGLFLSLFVLLPSLAGIGLRAALGEERLARARPGLKLLNTLTLLVLCYANAAVALPQTVSYPDWDFLAVLLGIVLTLGIVAFGSGWVLARLFRADEARQTALVYGLGMNNNGTGMVLAATALANLPRVMLPVIVYNLLQHILAGFIDYRRTRRDNARAAEDPATVALPLAKAC